MAPAADRERPSRKSSSAMATRRSSRTARLVAGRYIERRSRRLSHSSLRRPQHWEPRSFVFPAGQEPAWAAKGRNIGRFLGAGDGQGRRRILGGVYGAPGQQCSGDRPRSGAVAARAVDRQWRTADHRQAGQHHGPRLRCQPAADERRRDRFAPVRRCRRQNAICSGRTTPTASGRGRWRCCCASIRSSSSSCSRRRPIAAPPPSPRRSCHGPTCSGRWFASSSCTRSIEAALANWTQVRAALVEFGLAATHPRSHDDADPRPAHRR